MKPDQTECLFRENWDQQCIINEFLPQFRHPHKALLYRLAGGGMMHDGAGITVSRWSAWDTPVPHWSNRLNIEQCLGFYDYAPSADSSRMDWYMNFADAELFGFYGSSLFAQDELQVAEHPVLAAVREKLRGMSRSDDRYAPSTRDAAGRPTPVLLRGALRWIAIDTRPNSAAGRPRGLYGNELGRASAATLQQATQRLPQPTVSNLLAIEAPKGGHGRYRREQIVDAMQSACSGFALLRTESLTANPKPATVALHGGNWGCGAFGGNLALMYTVQMLAACWAGIELLRLYGTHPIAWEQAQRHYARLRLLRPDFQGAVAYLFSQGFTWGSGNGT